MILKTNFPRESLLRVLLSGFKMKILRSFLGKELLKAVLLEIHRL